MKSDSRPHWRDPCYAAGKGFDGIAFIAVLGGTVADMPDADQDRATAEDKASRAGLTHFDHKPERITGFRTAGGRAGARLQQAA